MTLRVLVCDDDPELGAGWVASITEVVPAEYQVLPLPGQGEIRKAAQELLHRRSAAREGSLRAKDECLFDDIDILLVDYDLLHVDEDNAQHTGEGLGRLARMFSNCGVVVVLNQFPGLHFDLSLRGHLGSHADVNIDGDLLACPGLWRDPPWEGFRPWVWQTLANAVATQRRRENIVREMFDQPIADVFGIQTEDAARLSDSAFGFVAPGAEDYRSFGAVTFQNFLSVTSGGRDARALHAFDAAAAVRFSAARIGKWLEREVLGPQDALIDVPHLLQRFPFLLGMNVVELDAWNGSIHDISGLKEQIDTTYWFQPEGFLSRPAVWGQRFQNDPEIARLRSEFDFGVVPNFVFAEDRSAFVEISEAKEFRAGFHNPFDRRFLCPVQGMRYAPQRRLAFGS